jgi:DNA-binding GntR family transcriptional regulator
MPNQVSIRDKIYNLIMEDILTYEYKPNDILNEKNLVEKYGCSKTPVREALLSLCDECVLRSIPRYGYEVVRITTEDIKEMLQYRYILEGGLISRSLDKFSERQIEHLQEIDNKCSESDKDVWEHWKHNTRFHMKLLSFCDNHYAVEAYNKTMDRLKRAYAQLYWNHMDNASLSLDTRYHGEIIQCLRDKDLENLLLNLRKDLSSFGGLNFAFDLNQDCLDK